MPTIAAVAAPTRAYELTSFTTRDVPWGKLGATLEGGAVTALEAATRGGLDFQVDLYPSGFKVRNENGRTVWHTVPNRHAVARRDTQQFMSYVSDDYVPVQFSEAFAFMDNINPRYVAAGTMGDGRQAFMVVKLPHRDGALDLLARPDHDNDLEPDLHQLYVVLRSSHDLTRAIEVSVMLLRDACMNALTLKTFTRGAKQRWSVKHVGDPLAKLQAARQVLSRTDAYLEEASTFARRLASTDLDLAEATRVLKLVLPDLPRRQRAIDTIFEGWDNAATNGYAGTGWGLTNAVSEYFEHGRVNRTDESYLTSSLNGQSHRYTNRTAQLLLRR